MAPLLALAAQAGLPILQGILSQRLGPANGQLASEVIRAVATRAGSTPETLEALAGTTPGKVIEAMREVERASPEMIALWTREVEAQAALTASEADEPLWVRAWRPLGMYGLGFLWLWNIVGLHVLNAIFHIALPAVGFDVLIQISGLYMGLYMGGHTVKEVAQTWKAKA